MAKKCLLTNNLGFKECEYDVGGVRELYLANYYPPVTGTESVAGKIAYEYDATGRVISAIHLPTGEYFYKIDGTENSLSWTDDLTETGNGGKFRTHTVNGVVAQYDATLLDEIDALSLGKFIAIPVDRAGRAVVLGRQNGLTATSANYASGAASADANGWTLALTSNAAEAAPLLEDEAVITPVYVEVIEP